MHMRIDRITGLKLEMIPILGMVKMKDEAL
jgi:hypothetical protein